MRNFIFLFTNSIEIKKRRLSWRDITRIGETTNLHSILMEEAEIKRPFRILSCSQKILLKWRLQIKDY